ncbi:hypothetical protein Tco_1181469, partial [Tanacetum coccineum]
MPAKVQDNEMILGGNYSSTEQINSIQQMIGYCLITGSEVDIEEIIYSDLITKLLSKSRLKYVSYPRFISCALEVLLEEFSVSTTFFWKEKEKSRTVTLTLPQSQGLEASGTLPQKRKKPKSKKPPTKTKHKPTTTTDPKDSEGNVQIADKGLPSTVSNEGTDKTTPRLERPLGDKDSEGNKTPADMEPINLTVADLSRTQVDENQSTRL